MVSAAISTIFAEPDGDADRQQLRDVVDKLSSNEPRVAEWIPGHGGPPAGVVPRFAT